MEYFTIYNRARRRGASDAEARRKAIDWGIRDEKTLHGFWASGVFSYADLEANYRGLEFCEDFCETNQPFLAKTTTGSWELVRTPDIRKYVNGYWDETFELSYRLPENWEKVSEVINEKYCELSKSPEVMKRFRYYLETNPVSFSRKYLRRSPETPGASQGIFQRHKILRKDRDHDQVPCEGAEPQ